MNLLHRMSIAVPEYARSSASAAEVKLRAMLRQQLCLEKLIMRNAIVMGQTAGLLRSQLDRASFSDLLQRLETGLNLQQNVKDTLELYLALAEREQDRHLVDSSVTVDEWLADASDVAAGDDDNATDSGEDDDEEEEEAEDEDDEEFVEGDVSADGEWSV